MVCSPLCRQQRRRRYIDCTVLLRLFANRFFPFYVIWNVHSLSISLHLVWFYLDWNIYCTRSKGIYIFIYIHGLCSLWYFEQINWTKKTDIRKLCLWILYVCWCSVIILLISFLDIECRNLSRNLNRFFSIMKVFEPVFWKLGHIIQQLHTILEIILWPYCLKKKIVTNS